MSSPNKRDLIIEAGLVLATRAGFKNVTQQAVATAAGVAKGTVTYHFTAMDRLHDAIMKKAVEDKNLDVVAQGLTARNWHATHAPEDVRKAAARHLVS